MKTARFSQVHCHFFGFKVGYLHTYFSGFLLFQVNVIFVIQSCLQKKVCIHALYNQPDCVKLDEVCEFRVTLNTAKWVFRFDADIFCLFSSLECLASTH